MNYIAKVCSAFLIIASVSFDGAARGTDDHGLETEIIEVLAPKSALMVKTANDTTHYLNPDFNFSSNRTIADQLATINGVNLNGQGGQFQSFAIRGFSRARVRSEIDGIPIITDRRAGNSLSFISPFLLSSGAVIKGPSSSIYGSQALGGVVNLHTEMQEGTAVKFAANFQEQGINLGWKHKSDNLSIGLAHQRAADATSPNDDTLNTSFSRTSGLMRYEEQFQDWQLSMSWLPSFGRDIGKSNLKFPLQENSVYPEEIHSLAQIQLSSKQDWSAKLFHHYQDWQSQTLRIEKYHASTDYRAQTTGGNWLTSHTLLTAKIALGIDWLSRQNVKINGDYQYFDEPANTTKSTNQPQTLVDGSEHNLGIFANAKWILDRMTLNANIRYDWLEQHNVFSPTTRDERYNASASVTVPINDKWQMTAELGSGFRFPTLSEKYFSGITPRGEIIGNSSLEAETSTGTELKIAGMIGDKVQLQASWFSYDLSNYIERYEIEQNTLSYRNLVRATVSGYELNIHWFNRDWLEQIVSYADQTGRADTQQPLEDIPANNLSWRVLTNFNKWQITNSISLKNDKKNVARSELPRANSVVWDLSINYEMSLRHTISLRANNLTNEEYFATADKDATLQPQRSFTLTSYWRF